MKEMTHRDEVHGDVRFDPVATALLDTSTLQRLGRIYQLGYGHLVYRGGTHTRLSHVMGAYHVAGKLVTALQRNYTRNLPKPSGAVDPREFLPFTNEPNLPEEDRWEILRYLVCWAALLHDIAHVPLGHTLEDEFDGIYNKHDDFASPRISLLWYKDQHGNLSEIRKVFNRGELFPNCFETLLRASGDAKRVNDTAWKIVMLICLFKDRTPEKVDRQEFKDILEPFRKSGDTFFSVLADALNDLQRTAFFPYMADIVGNTICADYLDYLQRDPRNLGLDVLRDDRVISRFWIGKDRLGQLRMALSLVDNSGKRRLDTCTGVVELVRQRYRFAEIVYYHKTKVAASAMFAKVFHLLGKPPEVAPPRTIISLRDVEEYVEKFRNLTDEKASALYAEVRQSCEPCSLLDPEIGDESLHLFLAQKAWEKLLETIKTKNFEELKRCLQAISLLQALIRRHLHKVCFTIDSDIFKGLSGIGDSAPDLEHELKVFIDRLRKGKEGEAERHRLETLMATASSWPSNSLILYVPSRKSQAKGYRDGSIK